MSYSGYKSSPRGGRGFIRGGYRGSSRGGGDGGNWRGGGGRGYGSSSRGRGGLYSSSSGKWDREGSSGYESRSRYNSGGERYSSHGREDSSYRYRDDSMGGYSSREHSHRAASPDRKRMRPDYSPATSMHRSHDYGEGIEYSSRSYGGYEGKRMSSYGGGDDRRNLFRDERERIRTDDFQFRKPLSIGTVRHSTPRGSPYRGRSFSRGLRSTFRRPDHYRGGSGFIRKRSLMESYGFRRRIATGRTQEYLRRLKMYRIQRLRRLRDNVDKEDSDDDDDDDEDDNEEEQEVEEEEEVEEEVTDEDSEDMSVNVKEGNAKIKKEMENEDEEMEEGVDEEKKDEAKKKTKKVKKIVKVIKKVKRKIPKKKDSEVDKNESNENKEIHVTVKQDSEGRDVDAPVRKNYLGQPFIKLDCPHCHTSCITFKEYLLHFYKSKHQAAMTNLTVKVRKTLAKMRLEQRTEQRDIDEECKLNNMNMRTFYCMICKLNYRSLKSEHLQSDKHKEMKNFLNPYCRICRVGCGTPMLYENHICSLGHLKRKHYFDKKNAERQEVNEIDMDNYMVLDQVGSGEEEEESDSESSEKVDKEKQDKEDVNAGEDGEKEPQEKKPKKKKKAINLGSEYCKKMEIYFCDLCKSFLPRIEDQEQALTVHCRGRSHLRWYVKKKDDIALRKRAERIHHMREEQRKAENKDETKSETLDEDGTEDQSKSEQDASNLKSSTNKSDGTEEMDVEAGMDEKLWTEVSKDIGDLLREVEPGNKSSDDEEDSRAAGRRYDRFKHSDKGKAGAKDENETKGKSVEEKSTKAEVVNGDDKDDA